MRKIAIFWGKSTDSLKRVIAKTKFFDKVFTICIFEDMKYAIIIVSRRRTALTEGCFLASWYKTRILKKALRYLRAFYFFSFSFYGTSIEIKPATAHDLDTILKIRSGAGNLKHLDATYIQQNVQEFVLAIINGTPVGIMRLFIPEKAPGTIEMGSFVKVKSALSDGASTLLIAHAQGIALDVQKTIIAITDKNHTQWCLAPCLERKGWTIGDTQEYSERLNLSPGKQVWEKIPTRLDPDSKIFMYP